MYLKSVISPNESVTAHTRGCGESFGFMPLGIGVIGVCVVCGRGDESEQGRCPPALAGVSPRRAARGGRAARGRAAAGALLPRYRPLTYRGRPERWAGVWAGGVKGVV